MGVMAVRDGPVGIFPNKTNLPVGGTNGLSADCDLQCVWDGFFGYQYQISTTACTGDFPAQRLMAIVFNALSYLVGNHIGEHGDLGFE